MPHHKRNKNAKLPKTINNSPTDHRKSIQKTHCIIPQKFWKKKSDSCPFNQNPKKSYENQSINHEHRMTADRNLLIDRKRRSRNRKKKNVVFQRHIGKIDVRLGERNMLTWYGQSLMSCPFWFHARWNRVNEFVLFLFFNLIIFSNFSFLINFVYFCFLLMIIFEKSSVIIIHDF